MIMKGLGAGHTDLRPSALRLSIFPAAAVSPLALASRRFLHCFKIPDPFPWDGICLLGIANLLLPVVEVNRETLQVVSLANDGLDAGSGTGFPQAQVAKFEKF